MAEDYKVLIGGQWVSSASGETFEVTNPANGEVVGTVPKCGVADVDAAVQAAEEQRRAGQPAR